MYILSSGLLDECIPDMPALDFPSRSLRNRLGNDNLFWDLELGNLSLESLLYPLLFLCIIPAVSRLENDTGPYNLAVLGVFNAKAYGFSHTLNREDSGVDLQGRELFATAINEFFDAPCEL